MRSKADISQFNLPHEESMESVLKKKKESYSGKDLHKVNVLNLEWKSEGVIDDESGESMEEVPLTELSETESGRPEA